MHPVDAYGGNPGDIPLTKAEAARVKIARQRWPKGIRYLQLYAEFNYAASIFRRFIRNELRESGCPGQVAEAWLSHASRGEEIYHKYSQFSMGAHRQALQHYLVPILNDLEFVPWGPATCPPR